MDRTVIVLTPSEWENRKPLSKCLSDAYQELHYAKSYDCIIDAALHVLHIQEHTKESLEALAKELISVRKDMMEHISKAQSIVNAVSTVIDYKERQGTVS